MEPRIALLAARLEAMESSVDRQISDLVEQRANMHELSVRKRISANIVDKLIRKQASNTMLAKESSIEVGTTGPLGNLLASNSTWLPNIEVIQNENQKTNLVISAQEQRILDADHELRELEAEYITINNNTKNMDKSFDAIYKKVNSDYNQAVDQSGYDLKKDRNINKNLEQLEVHIQDNDKRVLEIQSLQQKANAEWKKQLDSLKNQKREERQKLRQKLSQIKDESKKIVESKHSILQMPRSLQVEKYLYQTKMEIINKLQDQSSLLIQIIDYDIFLEDDGYLIQDHKELQFAQNRINQEQSTNDTFSEEQHKIQEIQKQSTVSPPASKIMQIFSLNETGSLQNTAAGISNASVSRAAVSPANRPSVEQHRATSNASEARRESDPFGLDGLVHHNRVNQNQNQNQNSLIRNDTNNTTKRQFKFENSSHGVPNLIQGYNYSTQGTSSQNSKSSVNHLQSQTLHLEPQRTQAQPNNTHQNHVAAVPTEPYTNTTEAQQTIWKLFPLHRPAQRVDLTSQRKPHALHADTGVAPSQPVYPTTHAAGKHSAAVNGRSQQTTVSPAYLKGNSASTESANIREMLFSPENQLPSTGLDDTDTIRAILVYDLIPQGPEGKILTLASVKDSLPIADNWILHNKREFSVEEYKKWTESILISLSKIKTKENEEILKCKKLVGSLNPNSSLNEIPNAQLPSTTPIKSFAHRRGALLGF